MLERYTKRSKQMTAAELHYALEDVQATLKLYRDVPPTQGYAAKLWADFDAYTVELERRLKKQGGAARLCPICNPEGYRPTRYASASTIEPCALGGPLAS